MENTYIKFEKQRDGYNRQQVDCCIHGFAEAYQSLFEEFEEVCSMLCRDILEEDKKNSA